MLSPSSDHAPLDNNVPSSSGHHNHITMTPHLPPNLMAPPHQATAAMGSGGTHEQLGVETDLSGDNGVNVMSAVTGYPYPYQTDSQQHQSYMMSINAAAAYGDSYNYPMISYPDGVTYGAVPQPYPSSSDAMFRTQQLLAAQSSVHHSATGGRFINIENSNYAHISGRGGSTEVLASTEQQQTSTQQQQSHLEPVRPSVPVAAPVDTHNVEGTSGIVMQNSTSDTLQPESTAISTGQVVVVEPMSDQQPGSVNVNVADVTTNDSDVLKNVDTFPVVTKTDLPPLSPEDRKQEEIEPPTPFCERTEQPVPSHERTELLAPSHEITEQVAPSREKIENEESS